MIKSKKQMFLTIIIFTLVMMLGTISYAFFNYTRTGSPNNFSVGRISFSSSNEQTITLNNLFPIDPTESGVMNDSTKVGTYQINITGDTDYADGLEYLVSIIDANIYTSTGKTIPISLDISTNGLGNENNNYFTARESKDTTMYKRLSTSSIVGDGMIMVGFIKPNTTSGTAEGVNGSITIKAYLDKNNIAISDTYDGSESFNNGTTNEWVNGRTVLTTSEWDAISNTGVSFKVKVEANKGIWVIGSIENLMRRNAVMDNINSTYVQNSTPGIDFSKISGDSNNDGTINNGKGTYIRSGTENDANPIVYYRGEIEDNNIIFGNKCWKAVRTTTDGGVKLIYNGEITYNKRELTREEYGTPVVNDAGFTFDETDNSWNATVGDEVNWDESLDLSFNLPNSGDYSVMIHTISPRIEDLELEIDVFNNDSRVTDTYAYYDEDEPYSNEVKEYGFAGTLNSSNLLKFEVWGEGNISQNPSSIKIKVYIADSSLGLGCENYDKSTIVRSVAENHPSNLISSISYMHGGNVLSNGGNTSSGAYYGSDFTWDGTNYKLVNPVTSRDANHHYTCNLTDANGECSTLRYYYGTYNGNISYVNLTNGKDISDIVKSFQANTNSSDLKTLVDNWYVNNLSSYTNKIEDTIYCNDRSIYQLGGWNPNGGQYNSDLEFVNYKRAITDSSPSLVCSKNDSFTVNNYNGNRSLTYPVAVVTADELVLAGLRDGASNGSTVNYMYHHDGGESLTPISITSVTYISFLDSLITRGVHLAFGVSYNINTTYRFRPMISIKPNQLIVSGEGTKTNPYVIE